MNSTPSDPNSARERVIRLLARHHNRVRRWILCFVVSITILALGMTFPVLIPIALIIPFLLNYILVSRKAALLRTLPNSSIRRLLNSQAENEAIQEAHDREVELREITARPTQQLKQVIGIGVFLALLVTLFITNPSERQFREHFENDGKIGLGIYHRKNMLLFSLFETDAVVLSAKYENLIGREKKVILGILGQFLEH